MNTAVTRAPAPAPALNLMRRRDLFSGDIVMTALRQSFVMLPPDVQWKNPVMFVVEIGAALTLLYIIQARSASRRVRCR
jgi:K+-transporting ATPase ATPase B chain